MPVQHLVENKARLLAFHFLGDVTYDQVEDAVKAVAETAAPGIRYCSLLVFDGSTDLSKIGLDALRAIKTVMTFCSQESAMQRPAGAIVIDGSLDARIIMPLWKEICDAETDIDIHYRFFIEVAPALAWLDVLETPALRRSLTLPQ